MQSGSFHFSSRSPRSGPEPEGLKAVGAASQMKTLFKNISQTPGYWK
jgi:hypothetical protein